jgi:hypothetical protein
MRAILSMGIGALFLAGCGNMVSTTRSECSQQITALRSHDVQMVRAERAARGGFTAKLASKGGQAHFCTPGRNGQIRCVVSTSSAPDAEVLRLQRERKDLVSRVAATCKS